MANIDKELRDIKNAVYGKEVRGSIHDGIKKINEESEESKAKADEAHDVMESIINEGFDNAALEANFEQKLDDKIANLQPEWTQFKNDTETRLADIENLKNYEVNSKARYKKGHVVFISDDAHKGDWEILKPIFESEGVPFCIAVVTEWMNDPTHPNHSTRMTWEQLEYLQNEMGCEIMSHSVTHGRPTPIPELPESELRKEYKDSRDELISRGFDVQSYRVPGGVYSTRERVIAKEYYRAMVQSRRGIDGLNHTPLSQYELFSIWLDNESAGGAREFEYYKDHIDRAVEEDALLIISTHGYILDGLSDLFRDVIQYAKNVSQVVTLREALNNMGNIIDVGDHTKIYSRKNEPDKKQHQTHYVVGADGVISGSASVTEPNRFTPETAFNKFPKGVTITPVKASHAEGSPRNHSGLLINYRTDDDDLRFNHQQYIDYLFPYQTSRRHVNDDYSFSDWYGDGGINYPRFNDYDHNTPFSDFSIGLTFSRITSDNTSIDLLPEGSPGQLMTVKTDRENAAPGFNYQEFRPFRSNNIYTRYVNDGSTFGAWKKVSGITLVDENEHTLEDGIGDFNEGVTYTELTSNHDLTNAPENAPGLLITHKVHSRSSRLAVNFQQYKLVYSSSTMKTYERRAESLSEWRDWVLVSGLTE